MAAGVKKLSLDAGNSLNVLKTEGVIGYNTPRRSDVDFSFRAMETGSLDAYDFNRDLMKFQTLYSQPFTDFSHWQQIKFELDETLANLAQLYFINASELLDHAPDEKAQEWEKAFDALPHEILEQDDFRLVGISANDIEQAYTLAWELVVAIQCGLLLFIDATREAATEVARHIRALLQKSWASFQLHGVTSFERAWFLHHGTHPPELSCGAGRGLFESN